MSKNSPSPSLQWQDRGIFGSLLGQIGEFVHLFSNLTSCSKIAFLSHHSTSVHNQLFFKYLHLITAIHPCTSTPIQFYTKQYKHGPQPVFKLTGQAFKSALRFGFRCGDVSINHIGLVKIKQDCSRTCA